MQFHHVPVIVIPASYFARNHSPSPSRSIFARKARMCASVSLSRQEKLFRRNSVFSLPPLSLSLSLSLSSFLCLCLSFPLFAFPPPFLRLRLGSKASKWLAVTSYEAQDAAESSLAFEGAFNWIRLIRLNSLRPAPSFPVSEGPFKFDRRDNPRTILVRWSSRDETFLDAVVACSLVSPAASGRLANLAMPISESFVGIFPRSDCAPTRGRV